VEHKPIARPQDLQPIHFELYVIVGIQVVHPDHLPTEIQQSLGYMISDEAGSAGYQSGLIGHCHHILNI
jgi:hypothetical protein